MLAQESASQTAAAPLLLVLTGRKSRMRVTGTKFVATYLTYKWKDRRGNVSTLKALIDTALAGQTIEKKIAIAKVQALNLGIVITSRNERVVLANKYKPHAGKKEAEKAAKRAAKANG